MPRTVRKIYCTLIAAHCSQMKLSVYAMNNHSSFYFSVILHYSQDMLLTKPTRHFTLSVTLRKEKKSHQGLYTN